MKNVNHGRKALLALSALLILSFLAVSAGAARAEEEKGRDFLWRVRSGTATVYLLGSIHVLKKDFYPLSKRIEDAFDRSAVLAVEADINNVSRMDITKMLEGAAYPGGDKVENHLSAGTYELLKKESAAAGIPMGLIGKQRPWFSAMTLMSFALLKSGFDPAYGVDLHFLSEAEGKKRIVELESIDFQMDLFSGLSDRDQEYFLLSTIKELRTLDSDAGRLVSAWKSGNVGGVESIMAEAEREKGMSPVYEKILYDRNKTMAAKIGELLDGRETAFVVVGAGHLVGERGIIAILKKKGYQVDQL
jgi:uncharacterized protein YbaP (TraB family)